jgi:hypothetical protein
MLRAGGILQEKEETIVVASSKRRLITEYCGEGGNMPQEQAQPGEWKYENCGGKYSRSHQADPSRVVVSALWRTVQWISCDITSSRIVCVI